MVEFNCDYPISAVKRLPTRPKSNWVYIVKSTGSPTFSMFVTDREGTPFAMSIPGFVPGDYDLIQFTNNDANPFARISDITGGGVTNLGYIASSTDGTVTSDTGTDATLPLATTTNAGLLSPADKTKIDNTSGNNSGDQNSIVGISGTKTQFNTALTDGDFLFSGDITQYTDEQAQDAIGTILTDSSTIDFTYNDGTPSITAIVKPDSISATELAPGINISEFNNDSGYITSAPGTDLTNTPSPTTVAINSSTGADTNIPLADGTNAGLLKPAKYLVLESTSGVNTGNQTSIVGITGTKAQYNTSVTDGDFLFVGDVLGTDLGNTPTPTTVTVTSSTGTSTNLPLATTTNAGLLAPADKTKLNNTTNTNSGDQTSIVGITGTKAQFNTAATDGDFLFVGDVTQYTDEMAQDAVGNGFDTTLVYNDGANSFGRAAITGDVTIASGSNASVLPVVNAGVGTFGSASQSVVETVNAKGQITAVSQTAIQIAESQVTNLTTDLAAKVTGPASATDNAIARFDLATGKLIQNSAVTIDDNGGIIIPGIASPTYTQGKLVYDTDNECLTFNNNDSAVSLQIGQEQWVRVKNTTGSTIANGAAVYINGSSSGLPTIALAQANSGTTSVGAGLTTESIANNAIGYVTSSGLVNSLDTSAFSVGAIYISSTVAGGLTQTAPVAPNYRYRIGFVTNVDATTGKIHVTPSTSALGNGSANQVSGINNAGTAQEYKTVAGATGFAAVNTANTITIGTSVSGLLKGNGTGVTAAVKGPDYDKSSFIYQTTVRNLTSNTTAQNIFDPNGVSQWNPDITGTYEFRLMLYGTNFSTTAGFISLGFAGTATIGAIAYIANVAKTTSTSGGTASPLILRNTTAASQITASNVNQICFGVVEGMIIVTATGTVIPQITMSQANAAIIQPGTKLTFKRIGSDTDVSTPDFN